MQVLLKWHQIYLAFWLNIFPFLILSFEYLWPILADDWTISSLLYQNSYQEFTSSYSVTVNSSQIYASPVSDGCKWHDFKMSGKYETFRKFSYISREG